MSNPDSDSARVLAAPVLRAVKLLAPFKDPTLPLVYLRFDPEGTVTVGTGTPQEFYQTAVKTWSFDGFPKCLAVGVKVPTNVRGYLRWENDALTLSGGRRIASVTTSWPFPVSDSEPCFPPDEKLDAGAFKQLSVLTGQHPRAPHALVYEGWQLASNGKQALRSPARSALRTGAVPHLLARKCRSGASLQFGRAGCWTVTRWSLNNRACSYVDAWLQVSVEDVERMVSLWDFPTLCRGELQTNKVHSKGSSDVCLDALVTWEIEPQVSVSVRAEYFQEACNLLVGEKLKVRLATPQHDRLVLEDGRSQVLVAANQPSAP